LGVFSRFCEELPGREALYRQATQACNPVLGFPNELPGGNEHPPGDASHVCLIFMFLGFCVVFDRWKMCLSHKMIEGRLSFVELHCRGRELSKN